MRPVAACAVAVALLSLSPACEFSQKHPAVTATILGGSIGFTTCEVDDAALPTCALIGASAAVFLGGIMTLVTLFADTTDHSLPSDEPVAPEIVRHKRPPTPDAGVDASEPSQDAASGDAVLSPAHD